MNRLLWPNDAICILSLKQALTNKAAIGRNGERKITKSIISQKHIMIG